VIAVKMKCYRTSNRKMAASIMSHHHHVRPRAFAHLILISTNKTNVNYSSVPQLSSSNSTQIINIPNTTEKLQNDVGNNYNGDQEWQVEGTTCWFGSQNIIFSNTSIGNIDDVERY
jgi:hypothetical protein